MGAAAIPIITSVIGAGATLAASSSASSATNKASKAQQGALDKKNAYQDFLKGIVDGAKKAGVFDANSQINTLKSDMSAWEKKDLQNAGGAASALGYRKGDTPAEDALMGVRAKFATRFAELSNSIRSNAFGQEFNAYRAASPDYSADLNVASNNLSYARSQQANTGDMSAMLAQLGQIKTSVDNPRRSTGPIYGNSGKFTDLDAGGSYLNYNQFKNYAMSPI